MTPAIWGMRKGDEVDGGNRKNGGSGEGEFAKLIGAILRRPDLLVLVELRVKSH
jgi:hypothetical protein